MAAEFGADHVILFLIGLLGGAHCIGMCGPLVTLYSERMDGHADRDALSLHEVRQHSLFNLGRAASYATIGAVFGAAGGVVYVTADTVTPVADLVRSVFGIVVGAFIISVGVYYVFGRTDALDGALPIGGLFRRVHGVLVRRVDAWVNSFGVVGLGALHGFLPCPMLYPAFFFAFAAGSAVQGFTYLAALGVGTIPAVFGYGVLVGSLGVKSRRRIHRVLGVVFIALGYIPLQHGLMGFGVHLPHPPVPYYQPLVGFV